MTTEIDLTRLAPESEALLEEGLAIMSSLNGSEDPVTLSAYYFRLAGVITALPGSGGTARQQVDRAALCEYVRGLAVGLTVLGRHIHMPEEAPRD